MTALLLITVLCTALALLARRFGWACTQEWLPVGCWC